MDMCYIVMSCSCFSEFIHVNIEEEEQQWVDGMDNCGFIGTDEVENPLLNRTSRTPLISQHRLKSWSTSVAQYGHTNDKDSMNDSLQPLLGDGSLSSLDQKTCNAGMTVIQETCDGNNEGMRSLLVTTAQSYIVCSIGKDNSQTVQKTVAQDPEATNETVCKLPPESPSQAPIWKSQNTLAMEQSSPAREEVGQGIAIPLSAQTQSLPSHHPFSLNLRTSSIQSKGPIQVQDYSSQHDVQTDGCFSTNISEDIYQSPSQIGLPEDQDSPRVNLTIESRPVCFPDQDMPDGLPQNGYHDYANGLTNGEFISLLKPFVCALCNNFQQFPLSAYVVSLND